MSSGQACICPGPIAERRAYWFIETYMGNYSAFNGYHFQHSDYSELSCALCGHWWRTKAGYVAGLTFSENARQRKEAPDAR